MIVAQCCTCGAEYEVGPFDQPLSWCSEACLDEFESIVRHIAGGGDPWEIGVDPASELYSAACKEIAARRRREAVYRRELRESEWWRDRPRPTRAIYPV